MFPQSGNLLFRFFFELLSEKATIYNDKRIYTEQFSEPINFNVNEDDKPWHVYTNLPPQDEPVDRLILVLKKPLNILPRASTNRFITSDGEFELMFNSHAFEKRATEYFSLIDYYITYEGDKKIFYYDDMVNNTESFIRELYSHIGENKDEKLQYVLDNMEYLYNLRMQRGYYVPPGITDTPEFWYDRLSNNEKSVIDEILNPYINNEKYTGIVF